MSSKAKLLAVALAAVATFAALKVVTTHGTHAPYMTAFRVTTANALADCPPTSCRNSPTGAHCVSSPGGCNLVITNGHASCGPVQICHIEPEFVPDEPYTP